MNLITGLKQMNGLNNNKLHKTCWASLIFNRRDDMNRGS